LPADSAGGNLPPVNKQRLEAFSDGVIAILITIMVLELKPPHGDTLDALRPLVPTLLAYLLSFVYLGIYWNNHHHLLHATRHVTGGALWANLHLLFWLSLVPFATSWIDESPGSIPTAVYGGIFLCAAVAFTILQRVLARNDGEHSRLSRALGDDHKGKVSLLCYTAGIALAFVRPWIADVMYVVVALIWLVPDRRMERAISE
jgi:uncharacterized membrane protein